MAEPSSNKSEPENNLNAQQPEPPLTQNPPAPVGVPPPPNPLASSVPYAQPGQPINATYASMPHGYPTLPQGPPFLLPVGFLVPLLARSKTEKTWGFTSSGCYFC